MSSTSGAPAAKPSPLTPHHSAKRLLWAGFFTIFAAGLGFGVRGAILIDWGREFGFTQVELGGISGGGLWGFGVIIILGSLIADRFGYGKLMIIAFAMHVASGILQMATSAIYQAYDPHGREAVYYSLTIAMLLFSVGNGICEVVVNPMVAALFPRQKTHYLNILHAGWPGGMIVGGLIGYVFNDLIKISWVIQMALFLVPVAIYGLMMVGQHFPRSEASQAGVSFKTMLAEFVAPILLLLLFIHLLVGYVELGTDSWIQKITGNIMNSRGAGMLLFVYTSGLMFVLRFFAGPLEHILSPLGLLFACAVIATAGLGVFGYVEGVFLCVVAATVYGIGKTFFWPTMLAIVSERFPRGGAVTIGAIGGVGALSGGLLGGPGIGFKQDYYASSHLKQESETVYKRYAANEPNSFLFLFHTRGLDNAKVGLLNLQADVLKHQTTLQGIVAKIAKLSGGDSYEALKKQKHKTEEDLQFADDELDRTLKNLGESKLKEQKDLAAWWAGDRQYASEDSKPVNQAGLFGSRMALKLTALVPALMAVLYLFLILYFRIFHGGYKALVIDQVAAEDQAMEKALGAPGSAEA